MWTMTGDPIAVEALARSGADFLGVDFQHGAMGFERAARAIQIGNLCGLPTYVRVSVEQVTWVPRLLDVGADGAILAMVDDPAQVERFLAATRYQPRGSRSYGGQRYGLRSEPADPRDLNVETYIQIETATAAEHAVELAHGELTGMFLGPVDLGLALSADFPVAAGDQAVAGAVGRVMEACSARGLRVGNFATDGGHAARLVADGFDDVVLASDIALLRSALGRELARAASGGEAER